MIRETLTGIAAGLLISAPYILEIINAVTR